jgi:transposase
MRPRKSFPLGSAEVLQKALKSARGVGEVRRIQAVLMRAIGDAPPAEIAAVTGLSIATVRILHSTFLTKGIEGLLGPGRGGARRRNLSHQEEAVILERFLEPAKSGGVIIVKAIHDAYEAAIGRQVSTSTTYRMLARHGWRKITPRSRHPKQDAAAQAGFKKRSQPELLRKSPLPAPKGGRSG